MVAGITTIKCKIATTLLRVNNGSCIPCIPRDLELELLGNNITTSPTTIFMFKWGVYQNSTACSTTSFEVEYGRSPSQTPNLNNVEFVDTKIVNYNIWDTLIFNVSYLIKMSPNDSAIVFRVRSRNAYSNMQSKWMYHNFLLDTCKYDNDCHGSICIDGQCLCKKGRNGRLCQNILFNTIDYPYNKDGTKRCLNSLKPRVETESNKKPLNSS